MIDYKNLVDEFQKGVVGLGHGYHQEYIPGNSVACIKAKLLAEECEELCQELYAEFYFEKTNNKEAVLKELCDVLYIAFGIAATYDLPIEQAFIRVHENNMLKLKYPIVDGKVIKAKDHPKVDLSDLV